MDRILIFTGNRAEYGLIYPIIQELKKKKKLKVQLAIGGAHVLRENGGTLREIRQDGIMPDYCMSYQLPKDGRDDVSIIFSQTVKSGAKILAQASPEILFIAGDRYETFAMAIAAYYRVLPIAHLFGGDLSRGGHLDDSVRHAITKLAHIHFTTNKDSTRRLIRLGEEPWRVHMVGSPFADNLRKGYFTDPQMVAKKLGLNMQKPILLFTQHPVTTESKQAYFQIKESLEALRPMGHQTVLTYPCNDSGSQDMIRALKEYNGVPHFRIVENLGRKNYLGLLQITSVVIGNSSSGIMETPFLNIPCVNIGTRQEGRLRGKNIIDVHYDRNEISRGVSKALFDKNFRRGVMKFRNPYPQCEASKKIADILENLNTTQEILKKKCTY